MIKFINGLIKQDDFKTLRTFLDDEYANYLVFPERNKIFGAFELVKENALKVVILGQDPYPNPNQAMGLSFSVPFDTVLPPSLRNIYKEIENEYNIKMAQNGDLTFLAQQGVLLLNSILTVRASFPLSHDTLEYKALCMKILMKINSLNQPIVFMLWGTKAKFYAKYLNNPHHLVLTANHPSPLSANRGGWFGCNHFIRTNDFLEKYGLSTINWNNNLI